MADQCGQVDGARISGGGYASQYQRIKLNACVLFAIGFLLMYLIFTALAATALTATAFSEQHELLGKEFAEDGKRLEFCLQRCMEGQIIYYLPEKAVSDLAAAVYVL